MTPPSSSITSRTSTEHEPPEITPEEARALAVELKHEKFHEVKAKLEADILKSLDLSDAQGDSILETVCRTLGRILERGQNADILGFGQFKIRFYRPARPARIGDHSFVEAPYLGPVEFTPSALLSSQLEAGQLNNSLVVRCDVLYAALREERSLPRGKTPQIIRSAIRAFTIALLKRGFVELPHVGRLVVRPRPVRLQIDQKSEKVSVLAQPKTVLMHPLRSLIRRIPNLTPDAAETTSPASAPLWQQENPPVADFDTNGEDVSPENL